jgi:hypothetical protein
MLMDSLVKKTDGLQCRSWDIGGPDICIGTLGQVYYAKEVLADLDKDLRGLRSVPFSFFTLSDGTSMSWS